MVSFVPDWGKQATLPYSQNDPWLQIFNYPQLLTSTKQKSQHIIRKSHNTLAIPVILLGAGTVEVVHQLANVRVIPVLLSRR